LVIKAIFFAKNYLRKLDFLDSIDSIGFFTKTAIICAISADETKSG
jgi:hypothetical protein